MHVTLCICALMPKLAVQTRVSLLVHYREARKPTNTGQLAVQCLPGSTVGVVGDRARPLALPLVGEEERGILLYPDEDAVPIHNFANVTQPLVLVVPDGNWRQAGKMRQRIAGLSNLPCVTLPERDGTNYRLRAEPRTGGLATLEAIAHALSILEGERGPATEAALLGVFQVMVDRTLWLRGMLRDEQVTGGIPPAARANDPRGGREADALFRPSSRWGSRCP